MPASPPRSYRPYLWPAYRELLKRSDAPILVGPFYGEVGFEALYWLPWLSKLRQDLQIDPKRLIPITRGGAACWYGTPAGVELYAMRTPQDLRIANKLLHAKTGFSKQYGVSTFDKLIYRDVAQTLGLTRYLTLHPSWMYTQLQDFWLAKRGLQWLMDRVAWTDLPAPQIEGLTLPEDYTVARFYFRGTWPKDQQTMAFSSAVLQQVSKLAPVILLNTGIHADDHQDFRPKTLPPNVQLLSDLVPMTVANNLLVQSAVIAKCSGFVGTYGGLAQLGLRYRKPSVTFFREWGGTALAHRQMSEAMAIQMNIPFLALRLGDLPALQGILPRIVVEQPPGLISPQDVADFAGTPA